jgi:predicted membrane channel-forming protein YqfA (hemolysin III family)
VLSVVVWWVVGRTVGFGPIAPYEAAVGEASRWCERVQSGLLREPANAISNAGFSIVGIAVLVTLARDDAETAQRSDRWGPFVGNSPYGLLYGYATTVLGPASAAMHATNTEWGRWADVLAMVIYIWVPTSYNLASIGQWRRSTGIALYGAVVTVYAVGSWIWGSRLGIGLDLFEVAIGLWAISELLHRFPRRWLRPLSGLLGVAMTPLAGVRPADLVTEPRRYWWVLFFWVPGLVARGVPVYRRSYLPWGVGGTVAFFGAFAIWQTGNDQHPWCRPDSLLQAHAVWHLLCAVAAYSFFRMLRTERPRV